RLSLLLLAVPALLLPCIAERAHVPPQRDAVEVGLTPRRLPREQARVDPPGARDPVEPGLVARTAAGVVGTVSLHQPSACRSTMPSSVIGAQKMGVWAKAPKAGGSSHNACFGTPSPKLVT